jgi:hypothetical protein
MSTKPVSARCQVLLDHQIKLDRLSMNDLEDMARCPVCFKEFDVDKVTDHLHLLLVHVPNEAKRSRLRRSLVW